MLMQKLMHWVENSLAPKLNKVNHNIYISVLKESVMQILPFILLGSLFCCFSILGGYIDNWPNFWVPFGWTMGKLGVFVAFLIPFNYCEKRRLRKQRLVAGLSGLVLFLICVTPVVIEEGMAGFGSASLGAGGMFVAIVTGLITCFIFGAFGKFSFFKEDSQIPDFVRVWFDQLLPIGITVCIGWILVLLMQVDLYGMILAFFMPLQKGLNSWWGFILFNFITVFIYSMGISGWMTTPISEPVRLSSIAANLSLIAAGTASVASLNIYVKEVMFVAYMWAGGIGCTLPLVYLLFFSKAKKLKALGKACLVPSLFNINEPVVFGCIAWNPLLMVPMWLQGLVIPALTWLFLKVFAFAPFPTIQFELWWLPYPLGTWITTSGSIRALIFLAISLTVSLMIWMPFFKVYEKQVMIEENENAEKEKEKLRKTA